MRGGWPANHCSTEEFDFWVSLSQWLKERWQKRFPDLWYRMFHLVTFLPAGRQGWGDAKK